jgi:hypothetical protein
MQYAIFIILLLSVSVANANVGIPVVSFGLPFMMLNLLFVVAIESIVVKRRHAGLNSKGIVSGVMVANLITTLFGYPVVAVLVALTAVSGLNIGWLLPFSELDKMNFYVSTAMFVTLVPCYFLSAWIEARWLRRHRVPAKTTWIANLASYCFLTAVVYLLPPTLLVSLGKHTFETSYKVIMTFASLIMGN